MRGSQLTWWSGVAGEVAIGCTYRLGVSLTNVGTQSSRFKVRQPDHPNIRAVYVKAEASAGVGSGATSMVSACPPCPPRPRPLDFIPTIL